MPTRGPNEDFVEFAHKLSRQPSLLQTLNAIVHEAVRTVPGTQDASISVRRRQRYETAASTGELPRTVDEIQYRSGEGPCLSSLEDGRYYCCDDLATDERWPRFGPRAVAATSVVSMASYRLFMEDEKILGALNLFSRLPAAFADLKPSLLAGLAMHSAVALAGANDREKARNMGEALESNRTIGVAIGVLMMAQKVTREDSFMLLRLTSQRQHRKLLDLAQEVIETGQLAPETKTHRRNP